jgi:hypothetical protein
VADDPKTSGLFTPGPSLDSPPTGDVEREAVASLKGYAYQVAVAASAWLDLDESGKLYLEVAEDYATVAQQSLSAVQVKDTAGSGSVTLNTQAIRDAVAAFVDLVENNKGRDVQFRYLTTSPVGTELKVNDRPAGEAGLVYWRKAAAGADVEPLRAKLNSGEFSPEVVAFVKVRNDAELRRDLLQKIHWDCEQPNIVGITRELEERLIVLGRDKFDIPAPEARRLADILIYQTLKKSILKNRSERVLTRADLYAAIDSTTKVMVSRQAANAMTQLGPLVASALTEGQGSGSAFGSVDTSWIVPSSDLPKARGIIPRKSLSDKIEDALVKYGQVILVGGSGLGKSLVAREVASRRAGGFATIDLRGLDATETSQRFDLTLGRIGVLEFDCLIFDDFNEIEGGQARVGFIRCVQALLRRDRSAIVTLYRRPSNRVLSEAGVEAEAVIDIPYFSEAEAGEIVRAAGGQINPWAKIAYAAGAQGHPQLVHAFVMGMAGRGWPKGEVRDIIIRGFASDDTDAERDAARRSMGAVLSDDARTLLYRLSLTHGRFDREIALKIGESPPPVPRPGEVLDELIGPWVETVGKNSFLVSPLAFNAGQGMLNAEEQRVVHELIARQKLSNKRIDASDANSILTHALIGKSARSLTALASSVLTAGNKTTDLLAEQFFMLPILRTDRPIFQENRSVSVMLRMAQFKLVAAKRDPKVISACVDALFQEISEEKAGQIKEALEALALAFVLNTIGVASYVRNWVELLQKFKSKVGASPVLQDYKKSVERSSKEVGGTFYGMIFSIGTAQIESVQRLEKILLDLDRIDAADRSLWLEYFDHKPSEYSLLINPPWVAEDRRKELKPAEEAERYKRLSTLALKWDNQPLAVQSIVARVVMFDEYMDDEKGAHKVIDEAIATFGENVVLLRARAKLFWRHSKHADAVKILRGIADKIGLDSSIDRAFALREAAISAASIGDWAQSEVWFAEAQTAAASKGLTDDMHVMAVGLEADKAVASLMYGNVKGALESMAECLIKLQKIKPDSSLKAAYCHRVVRHTVLWMDAKIDNRETIIDGKPIKMLPGTCSNPEPPASITELPLGPLDLAWYMLAEAEISSGVNAGIDQSLRSRLQQGPILFLEVTKGNRRITRDVLKVDSDRFASDLPAFLADMEYLRSQGKEMRESFDIMSPPRGDIPALSSAQLASGDVVGVAADAVIAFGLAAALQGMADPTVDLLASLTRTFGNDFPGKAVVEKWRGADAPLQPLDKTVIELVTLMHTGTHLEPRKVWEIGLRIFERIRQSNFRKALIPLLGNWLRGQWRRIIDQESFRMSRPMVTVPAVEANLAQQANNNEAFIASLLLSTAEAVGSPLAGNYEKLLKEISRGDK